MRKVNVPVEKLPRFSGKWVAIKNERIIAVADELEELRGIVTGTKKTPPIASAFKVPEKAKGPYIFSSPR